jgi:hypothetical protein
MLLMVLFWVLVVISALGGFWYWRTQPFLPGIGVTLLLIAMLGWKVFPPG